MRHQLLFLPMLFVAAATQIAAQLPAPTFEVASVKPNGSGDTSWSMNNAPGGRFVAKNVPLKELLKEAYHVKESQLLSVPSWVSDRYDIQAQMDESTAAAIRTMSQEQERARTALLLQALLVDRFKLTLHREAKELPVYALLVAKGGPKFKETALTPAELGPPDSQAPSGSPRKGPSAKMMRGELAMTGVTLDLFAELLTLRAGRPVLNETRLTGHYDFAMHWTADDEQNPASRGAGEGPPVEASAPLETGLGPTIFTALQEQLGLKLEPRKSRAEVLVIDHIERPSEN